MKSNLMYVSFTLTPTHKYLKYYSLINYSQQIIILFETNKILSDFEC